MEKENEEFFKWLFTKEKVKLYKETDIATEKEIYYPEEIKRIIDTKEMQRLKKILNLSNIIVDESTVYNTRYEHVLGTYDKGVTIYINQYKNADWRKQHESEEKKLEIIAELIELLTHDIGHLTFSHTLEALIGKRGTHEIITDRIIDERLKEVIERIDKRLPQVLKDRREKNKLATLKEGNVDLDRMDYLVHDILHLDSGELEIEQIVQRILEHTQIVEHEYNGQVQEIPVFENEVVKDIQRLAEIRLQKYKEYYNSNRTVATGRIYRNLCSEILQNGDIDDKFTRFLQECYESKDKLDLNTHQQSNDIVTLNEVFDIIEKSKNEKLRKMAILCMPTLSSMVNLVYKMIEFPEEVDRENAKLEDLIPNEEDRKMYKRIKKYVKGKQLTPRERQIKSLLLGSDGNKEEGFRIYNFGKNYEEVAKKLRQSGISDEIINKLTWNRKLNKYKVADKNFARTADGTIVELTEHPNFQFDLSPEYVSGGFTYDVMLQDMGLSEKEQKAIMQIMSEYEEENYVSKRIKSRPAIISYSEDNVFGRYSQEIEI